jgi:hypothetical protein
MGAIATTVRSRETLMARLADARARTDELFDLVRPEAMTRITRSSAMALSSKSPLNTGSCMPRPWLTCCISCRWTANSGAQLYQHPLRLR